MAQASATNFSVRFHILCDEAGFIVGRGRQTEVYRFFGVSQVTARNWLIEGICPRDETLQKIIKCLGRYGRLPENISSKVLQLWLEKGDSYIPNPFAAPKIDHRVGEHRSLNTYKIFRIVASQLDELGIDIDSFAHDEINKLLAELCDENLNNMSRNRANKIVRTRFASLRTDNA